MRILLTATKTEGEEVIVRRRYFEDTLKGWRIANEIAKQRGEAGWYCVIERE